MNHSSPAFLFLSALLLSCVVACGGDKAPNDAVTSENGDPSQPSNSDNASEVTGAADGTYAFTHKMNLKTDDNQFSSLAYDCSQCTFEQWKTIVPPEGWSKGPAQVLVADSGELRSTPTFEGVEPAVDFLDEVEGSEYINIAKVLDATIIGTTETSFVVEAQVMRDTLLVFNPGRRIHQLEDPTGRIFVLFAHGVNADNPVIPDLESEELLSSLVPPEGWLYSSYIADDGLSLDTPDIATVLAIRGEFELTWELIP